ncbi:hypothetical protein BIWAKO_00022 [Bosea sp. BIWAKO-01]|nr:hypothetical protein BIWAKO_00022 [Bosea sp. BIWAKO-01]
MRLKGVRPDVEMVRMDEINEAVEQLERRCALSLRQRHRFAGPAAGG